MLSTSDVTSGPRPEVLLVGSPPPETLVSGLGNLYRVTVAPTVVTVRDYLARRRPAVVVTAHTVADGSVTDVCREVKRGTNSPAILLITSDTDSVPQALIAGCDAVLLQPFAPNLLYARIARLIRLRTASTAPGAAPSADRAEHSNPLTAEQCGTNTVWFDLRCPRCADPGPTCFDFGAYRRAWYACLKCQNVWVGRRRE
jgi:CheY-like chemotaxis protein